jgi:hypothetical protein
MERKDKDSDAAGYGKPPTATRFRKGLSGNPAGRPKGKLNMATVIQRTLETKVVIKVNGKLREVTMAEAAMMRLASKSAEGDLRAVNMVIDLARKQEERAEQQEPQEPGFQEADQQVLQNFMERFQTTSIGGNDIETESDPKRENDGNL